MALPNLSVIAQTMKTLLPKLEVATVPTGAIMAFNDIPEGWLQCNGAEVSRTTYARLFAVIGTKWGAGDGSTTFNLPNMEGRVLQGTTNLSEVGTLKEASLPNITGWYSMTSTQSSLGGASSITEGCFKQRGGGNYSYQPGYTSSGTPNICLAFDASKADAAYSGSTNQPKAALTMLCIKS